MWTCLRWRTWQQTDRQKWDTAERKFGNHWVRDKSHGILLESSKVSIEDQTQQQQKDNTAALETLFCPTLSHGKKKKKKIHPLVADTSSDKDDKRESTKRIVSAPSFWISSSLWSGKTVSLEQESALFKPSTGTNQSSTKALQHWSTRWLWTVENPVNRCCDCVLNVKHGAVTERVWLGVMSNYVQQWIWIAARCGS